MLQFLKDNFDKLLLLALVECFAWPAVHGVAYAQRTNDMLLGALLGLLTGKLMASQTKP
jgi:hypothetical protein